MKGMKYAALPSSMMFIGIIGFFVSSVYFMKRWPSFGFSFVLIFGIMIVASILSMTHAPSEDIFRLDEFERTHKGGFYKESKNEKKLIHMFGLDKNKKKK
jgi:multisubunit Na+/H+ antiporter MnhB subunit